MSCYCGDKHCPQCHPPSLFDNKKSTVEDLRIAPISAEEIKRLLEEGRKNVEAAEKKRNEPPETPTGKCVFCGGLVKGEYKHELSAGVDSRFVPIGPGGRQYYGWQFKGYHCTSCGLSYKFPPPEGILTQQGKRQ